MSQEVTRQMNNKEEIQEPDLAAQHEQKALEDFRRVLRYTRKEPALLLTALYFFLSFAGLLHLYVLLDNFNVNVLPHLELTDFLLGAVYFPKIFVYYAGLIIVITLAFALDRWCRKRFSFYRRHHNKSYESMYGVSFTHIVVLVAVLYLWVAVKIEASQNFHEVLSAENSTFNLHFTDPTRVGDEVSMQLDNVQVIANLSKHLWVFDTANRQVYMLPHDSVVALELVVAAVENQEVSDE